MRCAGVVGARAVRAACRCEPCSRCHCLPTHTLPPHIPHTQAAYRCLVELAVRSGRPRLALELCAEGHAAGALRTYALPDISPAAPPPPGTALGNALDLR